MTHGTCHMSYDMAIEQHHMCHTYTHDMCHTYTHDMCHTYTHDMAHVVSHGDMTCIYHTLLVYTTHYLLDILDIIRLYLGYDDMIIATTWDMIIART
jgi:hypothetical protein